MLQWINTTFPLGLSRDSESSKPGHPTRKCQFLIDRIKQSYERKVSHGAFEAVAGLERYIILNAIDRLWQEHLYAMEACAKEFICAVTAKRPWLSLGRGL